MSTALSTGAPKGALPAISKNAKVAIVAATWNSHITSPLAQGAIELLDSRGVAHELFHVPGTVELTYAAARLQPLFDAVIIIGCVIRGDTPHFDYVCRTVTDGLTQLNLNAECPVIFGVLTVNDEQQALDRAGGRLGNKGTEAAEAAIHMISFAEATSLTTTL
ncbi:6,7-dimethyl-8-ribityllumazine synthase [uncultured Muribaculum sp.]|uniref:6,7-dimethyl-8-ribityllumazine synthase n=1 Tax=uncultured Muribaculum sp. TaxID=1918613 RepID=UPI0025F86DEB|nr:6,7-dimethyl-8-ribityllumazine synthase [uncultured Muribaculum sp.]